jgi:hypothetical protein
MTVGAPTAGAAAAAKAALVKATALSSASGRDTLSKATTGASPRAVLSPPEWCGDSDVIAGGFWGTRTEGCQWLGLTYHTFITEDGVKTPTGEADMAVLEFVYGDPTLSTTAFQLMVSPYAGEGDAVPASVIGTPFAGSGCTLGSSSFPAQALAPFGQTGFRSGQAYFDTTATASGAIANCTGNWQLTFTNPGYPPAVSPTYTVNQFRCDNATLGVTNPGCVIPWAGEYLIYRTLDTPELAAHVARAQASKLPGAVGGTPLTRTTDPTTIKNNRNRACYQTPSISGKSCDEYPVATSQQGLASFTPTTWQSHRRTFDGCGFSLPEQDGPVGASACMISATEQSSQGGTNNAFYREWRMLTGDPFWIDIE